MAEITKKQFTYRGKTIEELKKMDVREFSKYLRASERRAVLRNFQKIEDFIRRANKKIKKDKPVKTHQRNLIIVPEMVGMKIYIHGGNKFVPAEVKGEMLGHRFGEFSPTRGKIKHSKAGVGATKGTKHKAKK
jgi:small subunit ribosomal protein S19